MASMAMRRLLLLFSVGASGLVLALALARPARGAGPEAESPVAAAYVREALARNLGLQARALNLEQAQSRLAEARSAYLPRLDLVARYSVADGGRTIDFPAGDLLNGVYRTLNELLVSQGRPTAFPQIENQSIALLRDREQETKLRLTQPLYRPEIARGVHASRSAAASQASQLDAYKRELRYTVLMAYHHYVQAVLAERILASAAELTTEALRVNRVLAEADKVTPDRVLRAEADDLAVAQARAEAQRDRRTAQAYFNTLLDRPLDAAILEEAAERLAAGAEWLASDRVALPDSPARREELRALEQAVAAAEAAESAVRARLLPKLGLAVEGGIQGTSYRRGEGSDFVQGSVVGEINLWDGHERRSQLAQARIERRRVELQLASARQQLALEVQAAGDTFRAAQAGYRAAQRRSEAAREAFALVEAREREGLASQLTFLDARNELTRAELNAAITRQQLFVAAAALDRAAAESPLPEL